MSGRRRAGVSAAITAVCLLIDLDVVAGYTGAISWSDFGGSRILGAVLLQLGAVWLLPQYIEHVLGDPQQDYPRFVFGSKMRAAMFGLIVLIVSAMFSWVLLYLAVNCPQAPFPTVRGVPYCSQKAQ